MARTHWQFLVFIFIYIYLLLYTHSFLFIWKPVNLKWCTRVRAVSCTVASVERMQNGHCRQPCSERHCLLMKEGRKLATLRPFLLPRLPLSLPPSYRPMPAAVTWAVQTGKACMNGKTLLPESRSNTLSILSCVRVSLVSLTLFLCLYFYLTVCVCVSASARICDCYCVCRSVTMARCA